ncbi:bacterio-opsin activator domain-containing protein [Haloarcula salinisoli]|uniref:Helix-turn-helix domain-containing protein n=1 Tax=Haloarcula salinisoli TaxID=2487746 RepID=A0A8J7YF51_9EURY|nr:bacterio-opsin activator domain-containing protein [Halomicroarcula salinisoli]MBX0286319.1 helix-turn-helix domain-containing protein [Halomicroarcula salinisoli]MBX0302193.1 helix-turn-helix domain-containing protein [Halomicroarcula salinisoli]
MEGRSVLDEIYAATLRVFTDSDEPTAPRTTPEVAAELDCGRRATHKRLEHLVDVGELRTKKVGAGARVWWSPSDTDSRDRRRLRELLTHAERLGDVGAWEYDIDDAELFWTDGTYRIHGVDREYEPELETALEFFHPEDRSTIRRLFESCAETGTPYSAEPRLITADGETRWVNVSGEAIAEGGHEKVRGYLQDITAQKEELLESQRADLEVLNSLNAVVRQLTDAVIDQSTRAEIEATTCERLASAEPYRFAWIATIDPVTLDFIPRVEHGCEGYVTETDLTSNPTEPGGQGPAGRAVRTQEMQFSRDVYADPDFEPWLDLAERYGYRSMAVIPIVFEETLYGTLGIYSERAGAFGQAEREVLEGIGEIVGHAIAAVERKQALLSDEVVELAFRFGNADSRMGIPPSFEASLEFESTLSLGDGVFLVYCTATDVDPESMTAVVDSDEIRYIEDVTLLGETNGDYELEVKMVDPPVLSTVASLGGYVSNVTITGDSTTMTVHLAADGDVSEAIDRIRDAEHDVEMLRRRQMTRPVRSFGGLLKRLPDSLTERQRATLDAAYFMGYFDWPRESSGPEVAERLGVSSSTFHQHLRKAEAKLLDAVFE